MPRSSFQGHTARINKNFKTKSRTHGQRIYKNEPGHGAKRAPRPDTNTGACMGLSELPKFSTPPAFSPAVCQRIDRELRECQKRLAESGQMSMERAYSTPIRHEIERRLIRKYEHLRVD
jgi:hypothetical protein